MHRAHRPLLFACLLAVSGALAALWWLGTDDPQRDVPQPPPGEWRAAPERSERTTARDGVAEGGATPAERTAAPTDAVTSTPPASAAGLRIHGTITVSDARGAEHAQCSGSLRLALLVPNADSAILVYQEQDVAVTAGRWQGVAPLDAVELRVSHADLDGRRAQCKDEFPLTTPEQPMALRAKWLEALRVRVLADDTGADLDGVRVVQMVDWQLADCTHPGNSNIHEVLADARSPLQIRHASTSDAERYWMKAPGYAWNQIAMATTEPGERVLRLLPGGDVDLSFVGIVPRGAVLRVRRGDDGGRPFAELVPSASSTTRVDALPAGTWQLTLEQGLWFQDCLVLGQTTAVVTASTIATAAITLRADVARPPAVEVRGTLRLSPKWGTDVSLELEARADLRAWTEETTRIELGEMTKVKEGVYRFGPTTLLRGPHQLLVDGTEHRALVEVGPQATELEVVVPEPNEVRVRVLDATSEQPLAGANVSWFSLVDGWDGGWGHASTREAGDGWYHFLAPAGRIKVSLHPDGYSWLTKEHVVQAGANEVTLRIARACGVEVTLKDGDVVLPFPDHARVQIGHVVTKAGVAYWSGTKVAAKEPGEHVLTIDPLEGFLPVEPRRVVIEPAKWTKVEIVLRRKP